MKDFPSLSEADLPRLAPPTFASEASHHHHIVRMAGETVRYTP
jgi:hypothetical protein